MEDRTTPASVRLSVPQNLVGAVGTTTVVPVNLDLIDLGTTNVNGGTVAVRWDPAVFDVGNVRLGPALAGGSFALAPTLDPGAGTLVAVLTDGSGNGVDLPAGAAGAVMLMDFAVKAGAAPGTEAVNLDDQIDTAVTGMTGIDGPHFLDPPPTDDPTDEVDGVFEVTAAVTTAALTVPRTLAARPGDVVTVPINLDVAAPDGVGVLSATYTLRWDPAVLSVADAADVRVGPGLPGFVLGAVQIDPVAGVLTTTAQRADGQPVLVPQGAAGAVLLVDFTVAADAAPGPVRVNLFDDPMGLRTVLTDGDGAKPVGLNPAPGAADNDPADGLLTVSFGPAVTGIGSVGTPRTAAVGSVAVTFSEAINTGTLTAADVTLTRDGEAVPLAGLTVTPVAGTPATYTVAGLGGFTDAAGVYVLTVAGAGVANPGGVTGSGSAGVTFTIDRSAPTVAAVEPPASPRNTPVPSVEVTFSEPVNPATFTADDLTLFRDGTGVDLSGVTVAAKPGTEATFVVSGLDTVTGGEGTYALTVGGAGVVDVAGNSGGGSKVVTFEVDRTGPAVTAVGQPATPRNTAVDTIDVIFNESPAAGSVSADDFTLTRDGAAVPLVGVTAAVISPTTVRVSGLAGLTGADGTYAFTATGAATADALGNPGSGSKSATFTTDRTPPAVLAVTLPPGRPDTTPVDQVTVEFTEPIVAGSFDVAALSLSRDGEAVPLAGVTVTAAGGNRFTVAGLGDRTIAQGTYTLTVTAGGVLDLVGNAGSGSERATWFADRLPAVVSITPAGGVTGSPPVLVYRVTFTEPVTGVTAAVFRAVGTDGAPATLPVTAVAAVGGAGGLSDTFDVTVGVGVGVDGAVALGLGAADEVRDATGNPLAPSDPNSAAVPVDTAAPVGRVEQAAGQADPAVGREVRFAVRFSEPVTGFGTAGVSVSGPTGTRVLEVTGAGADYVVRVGGYTAGGAVTVGMLAGSATDAAGNPATVDSTGDRTIQVTPGGGLPTTFAVGAGAGGSVGHFNPGGSPRSVREAFAGTVGGVRTAAADFNGDGTADVAVGTGPGGASQVRILDGASGAELFTVAPFEAAFLGGVYLAAGDLTGDGVPELVVTPDEGGGPRVQVYNGPGFTKLIDFFGIDDPAFRGGARAALGDVTGDGRADLLVSAGFGGGPRISGYDGAALAGGRFVRPFTDFFLFEPALRNGAFLAVGDVNGDGTADLIGGGGPGGGPRVLVVSGKMLTGPGAEAAVAAPLANFFAGNADNRGGVRVTAKDLDGDARADLVVGDGAGAGSRVTGYLGKDFAGGDAPPVFGFDAFPGTTDGVFVG